MSRAVVDTDVVSFIFKKRTLLISFMTLAELERWAIQSKWGKDRRRCVAELNVLTPGSPRQPYGTMSRW